MITLLNSSTKLRRGEPAQPRKGAGVCIFVKKQKGLNLEGTTNKGDRETLTGYNVLGVQDLMQGSQSAGLPRCFYLCSTLKQILQKCHKPLALVPTKGTNPYRVAPGTSHCLQAHVMACLIDEVQSSWPFLFSPNYEKMTFFEFLPT